MRKNKEERQKEKEDHPTMQMVKKEGVAARTSTGN